MKYMALIYGDPPAEAWHAEFADFTAGWQATEASWQPAF